MDDDAEVRRSWARLRNVYGDKTYHTEL